MVGIALGACFAARVSDAAVLLFVGAIAAGFVLYAWLRRSPANEGPQAASVGPGLFWGACAGFTSFIANAGGPPFQAYALPLRLPPQRYAGTQTMIFAVFNFVKLLAFFALGQVSTENFAVSASLFPVAIAATFAGVWLVRRVQAAAFYRIVYTLTFLLGCKLVYDGLRGVGAI